jgi:hypothetical protein
MSSSEVVNLGGNDGSNLLFFPDQVFSLNITGRGTYTDTRPVSDGATCMYDLTPLPAGWRWFTA